MNLPAGTVTFLFTDIAGSTRLWEEYPEVMGSALARHDGLLRAAIEQHAGTVFKTIGDGFCAAFHTAPDALLAALTAQQALISEAWPEPVTMQVRMALYTGAAKFRDNDYFGQPLNRTARLLDAGHGGQILVSLSTEEQVRDAFSSSITLKAMGEYRLRDLSRPETVFQLLHPDLPSEFPVLKSLEYLPNNLPLQLTSFVGREDEMAEIKTLLSKTRLLTLTGSGGSGKTRLALQVAAEMLEQFPEGVWLVELAPLADPGLAPQTVAQILGVKEEAGQTIQQTLITHLKGKQVLLILDNCEHVLSASAQLSDALLRSCPNVKILATSREGLGMAGELTYRVPSLSLPDLKHGVTPESMHGYEAVRLFIERALFHLPAFTVTDQNAPALASVCHRLDGIPLAIELAAARVRSLSVEEINNKLDNRFRLLTGGSKTALPRQQTLRALIDWSYDLLSAQEKALLLRLSVFAGGWTPEAAGSVCAEPDIEAWELLDLLTGLADKSLVIAQVKGDTTRYHLLETVCRYASDRLMMWGESAAVRARHRDYFLALAEEIEPKLRGADQAHWLTVLAEEHDNLRQALTFCREDPEGGEAGLLLGTALWRFWQIRGLYGEGGEWIEALLAHPGAQDPTGARAGALNVAGALAFMQGDATRSRTQFEASLAIRRALGNQQGVALSLNNLGIVVKEQNDYAAARALYAESLEIQRELGDRWGIALALANLGGVAQIQGEYDSARSLQEESLVISRELGDMQVIAYSLGALGSLAYEQGDYGAARALAEESLTIRRELEDRRGIADSLSTLGNVAKEQGDHTAACMAYEESLAIRRDLEDRIGIAYSLSHLGDVAYNQGDYGSAGAHYEESLTIARELRDRRVIAYSLCNLGRVAIEQGDYASARVLLTESLPVFREMRDRRVIAYTLEAFASLAAREENAARAMHLWGAATALRELLGCPLPFIVFEKQEREMATVRQALGELLFNAVWEEGRALNWESAVAYALRRETEETK